MSKIIINSTSKNKKEFKVDDGDTIRIQYNSDFYFEIKLIKEDEIEIRTMPNPVIIEPTISNCINLKIKPYKF